jgi:hypothetical protein
MAKKSYMNEVMNVAEEKKEMAMKKPKAVKKGKVVKKKKAKAC